MNMPYKPNVTVPVFDRSMASTKLESRGGLSEIITHGFHGAAIRKQHRNELAEIRLAGRREVEEHKVQLQVMAEKAYNQSAVSEIVTQLQRNNLDNFSRVVMTCHADGRDNATSVVRGADQFTKSVQTQVNNGELDEGWARFLVERELCRTRDTISVLDGTTDEFIQQQREMIKGVLTRTKV